MKYRSQNVLRATVLGVLMLAAAPVPAATYYVDFVAGSDANAGTSKSSSWQHSPGMSGCATLCALKTPTAGDRFIFKGGVTWPQSALPLKVTSSGSNGNNTYYGVDSAWYEGANSGTVNTSGNQVSWVAGNAFQHNGSWDGGSILINGINYTVSSVQSPYALTLTSSAGEQKGAGYSNSLFVRPVFDGNGLVSQIIRTTAGVSYITVDSLELTGQMTTVADGSNASVSIDGAYNGNIVLENLDVHSWDRCTGPGAPTSVCTSAVTDNSYSGGGVYAGMYDGLSPVNMIIRYSNVGNPENGGNIGACTRGMQQVIGNYLHDCSQACLHGCSLVKDNVVYRVGNSFDGNTHTNGFYSDCFDQQCGSSLTTATAYLFNNWIIDMQGSSGAAILYPNPGTAGVTDSVKYYVFNNVVSCSLANSCVAFIADDVDPYNASGATMSVYDWNNTYELTANGLCTRAVGRTVPLTLLDVRNLHCVVPSGGTLVTAENTTTSSGGNQLLQTTSTASAQGYFPPTRRPTATSGGTVAAGANLSSNCTGILAALCSDTTLGGTRNGVSRPLGSAAWDIGAFYFNASVVAPPTALSSVVH